MLSTLSVTDVQTLAPSGQACERFGEFSEVVLTLAVDRPLLCWWFTPYALPVGSLCRMTSAVGRSIEKFAQAHYHLGWPLCPRTLTIRVPLRLGSAGCFVADLSLSCHQNAGHIIQSCLSKCPTGEPRPESPAFKKHGFEKGRKRE